ncbi:MAG: drug/metabolite transporter (DMT)-like permease [Saprospiraceae bacterium]|jgi:drug/metabolite transporter (DMT)-like permease
MGVKWKAIRYMIFSMMAFAAMNFVVKYLDDYSAWQIAFFRAAGTLFITIPLIFRKRISIWGNERQLLVTRAIVGTTSLILYFLAIKLMPLGTCVTFRYMSPIFAALFALWILREKIMHVQWLFFFTSMMGVVLIKGFDPSLSILGMTLAIISGALSGLVVVIIRKIGDRDDPVVIVNYFMMVCTAVGLIGSLNTWLQPSGFDWILLGLLGILGFLGQYFMTIAAQMETTDVVAPMKYIEIPFTILIGMTFFGETFGWISVIGFIFIITGLIANVIYKSKIVKT